MDFYRLFVENQEHFNINQFLSSNQQNLLKFPLGTQRQRSKEHLVKSNKNFNFSWFWA